MKLPLSLESLVKGVPQGKVDPVAQGEIPAMLQFFVALMQSQDPQGTKAITESEEHEENWENSAKSACAKVINTIARENNS